MIITKYDNFINENEQEELGDILLKYDTDEPTTWFYIEDAISNGLLEEKLNLDQDTIDIFCSEFFNEDFCSAEELGNMILEDFDGIIGKLLKFCLETNLIDKLPSSVSIKGNDENGDFYDLEWINE